MSTSPTSSRGLARVGRLRRHDPPDRSRGEVEKVEQEIIWADGMQAAGLKRVRREVSGVGRDYRVCLAQPRGRGHMPVIRVWQVDPPDQGLPAEDARVGEGQVHRPEPRLDAGRRQVWMDPPDGLFRFREHPRRPHGSEQPRLGRPENGVRQSDRHQRVRIEEGGEHQTAERLAAFNASA
jgi:hypothetical protein